MDLQLKDICPDGTYDVFLNVHSLYTYVMQYLHREKHKGLELARYKLTACEEKLQAYFIDEADRERLVQERNALQVLIPNLIRSSLSRFKKDT